MACPLSSLRLLVLAQGFYVGDIEQVNVAVIHVLYLGQNNWYPEFYFFPPDYSSFSVGKDRNITWNGS
jgi:hypothetical protein